MTAFLNSLTISLDEKLDRITIITTSVNALLALIFSLYFSIVNFDLLISLVIYPLLFFNFAPLWWNLFFRNSFHIAKHIYLTCSFLAVYAVNLVLGYSSNVHLVAVVIVVDSMLFFGYRRLFNIFIYSFLTLLAFVIPIFRLEITGFSKPEFIQIRPEIFRFSIEAVVVFSIFFKMLLLAKLIDSERSKTEKGLNDLSIALTGKNFLVKALLHDVRAPLSSCILALRNFRLNEFNKEKALINANCSLITIESGQHAIKEIIDNLTILNSDVKTIQITKKTHSLFELLNAAIHICKSRATEKQIEIKIGHFDKNIQVAVDRDSFIYQILGNLFSNAIKFSEPKSFFEITFHVNNQILLFEIKNKGQFNLNTLNNQNYSSSGTWGEKGTGVGLTIVRQFSSMNEIDFSITNSGEFAVVSLGIGIE